MDPSQGESSRARELSGRAREGARGEQIPRPIESDLISHEQSALGSGAHATSSSLSIDLLVAPIFIPLADQGPSAEEIRRLERERQRARRSAETSSQRAARLAAQRQLRAERLREESPSERESRLERRRAASRRQQNHDGHAAVIPLHGAAFCYDSEVDYSCHPLIDFGKLDKSCRFCSARCFRAEADGLCCAKGKLRVQPIEQPPEPILTLFSGDYPGSRDFLRHIRLYNSCFQMTSFGATGAAPDGDFSPTFRVQGQIYHLIGSLLPLPNAEPAFLQIYFMGDSSVQLDRRCNLFNGVQRGIVANFQELQNSS